MRIACLAVLRLELDDAHPTEVGADARRRSRAASGTSSAFDVHSASLSVLPLSQNPRQSSSPSAEAIGAKLVSPPLFQSMYSSASYSARRHVEVGVGEHDHAGLGEHRQARMRRVERDLHAPVVGVRPERGHDDNVTADPDARGGRHAADVLRGGGRPDRGLRRQRRRGLTGHGRWQLIGDETFAVGSTRNWSAWMSSGLSSSGFAASSAWTGIAEATAISVSVSPDCTW